MAFNKDFIVKNGLVVQTTATVLSTIITNSTNSGALVVTGGVGIGQNLWVGSTVTVALTSTSISTNTGALQVQGGVGIAGASFFGSRVTVNNTLTVTSFTGATSTNTGALVVQGGAGIWQNLYVGGNLNVGGTISGSFVGTINTATNLAGGAAGGIPYQTAPGQTAFIGIGTAGFILQSNGSSATWVSTSTLGIGGGGLISPYAGIFTITNTTVSISTTTGALQVAGGVGIGGVLNVGGVGSTSTFRSEVDIFATTSATNTTTGALQVVGGVGVGGSIYVGNRVGYVNTSNVSAVYQVYNAATNSLDTVFG